MRIHAGTLGTLPREVGRSLSDHDQVLLLGQKKSIKSCLRVQGGQGKLFARFFGSLCSPLIFLACPLVIMVRVPPPLYKLFVL